MTRISFILATKNRGEALERALQGYAKYRSNKDELILVDGLSSDNTTEVIRKNRSIIEVVISEADKSEGHAINKGILSARGEIIKFVTDDDEFLKDGIDYACKCLEDRDDIDVLHTGGECRQEGKDGAMRTIWYQAWEGQSGRLWWASRCGLGMFVRRKAISKIGLIDIRHKLVDMSFSIQAIARGATCGFLMRKTFVHYRVGNSCTANATPAQLRKWIRQICRNQNVPYRLQFQWLHPRINNALTFDPYKRRLLAVFGGSTSPKIAEPDWDGSYHAQLDSSA